MNHKLKFILPRLAGLTLIVGAGALLLSFIFKALLFGLFAIGVVSLVRYFINNSRNRQLQHQYPLSLQPASSTFQSFEKVPVNAGQKTIVPIY